MFFERPNIATMEFALGQITTLEEIEKSLDIQWDRGERVCVPLSFFCLTYSFSSLSSSLVE